MEEKRLNSLKNNAVGEWRSEESGMQSIEKGSLQYRMTRLMYLAPPRKDEKETR